MSNEAATIKKVYAPELLSPRAVFRQIKSHLHREGMNVANFLGDVEDMLLDGQFYGLNARDFRALSHFHRTAIRPADNAEGAEVSLSGRQWGAFVGIRRTYQLARRDPQNLINHLRATRVTTQNTDETQP